MFRITFKTALYNHNSYRIEKNQFIKIGSHYVKLNKKQHRFYIYESEIYTAKEDSIRTASKIYNACLSDLQATKSLPDIANYTVIFTKNSVNNRDIYTAILYKYYKGDFYS